MRWWAMRRWSMIDRAPVNRMVSGLTNRQPAPAQAAQLPRAIAASDWERWLASAKAGARIIYAEGPHLPNGAASVLCAREAAAAGLVDLVAATIIDVETRGSHQRWRHFIAARRSSAAPAMRAAQIRPVEPVEADILHLLSRAADLRQYAPSNNAIAAALGLRDRHAARYFVKKLVAAGAISVADAGPQSPRVITITATGRSTRAVLP